MRRMMNIALIAALLAAVMAGSASADINYLYAIDPVDFTLTTPYLGLPGVVVDTFNSGTTLAAWTYNVAPDNNGAIVMGSVLNVYSAPAINDGPLTGTKDPTYYFTVPETLDTTDPVVNSSMVQFNATYDYLGLFWGSVDEYNTFEFYNSGSLVATYTGAQVILDIAEYGDQLSDKSNLYVNFVDIPTFDAVRFTSSQYAFEFDNLAVGNAVPVPGAVLLGLLGLGAAGVKLRKRA